MAMAAKREMTDIRHLCKFRENFRPSALAQQCRYG
jgi:hypothetical protein